MARIFEHMCETASTHLGQARLEDRNLLRLLPKLLEKLGTAREARVFICIERGL